MNIDDFKNSTYLTQQDVNELSLEERRVTIDHVEAEVVGKDKELKPVTYFKTLGKGLVTNMTNREKIAEIRRSKVMDDWPGTRIELYVNPDIGFGGKRMGGIRVRRIAKNDPSSVEEDFDEEIPFGDSGAA